MVENAQRNKRAIDPVKVEEVKRRLKLGERSKDIAVAVGVSAPFVSTVKTAMERAGELRQKRITTVVGDDTPLERRETADDGYSGRPIAADPELAPKNKFDETTAQRKARVEQMLKEGKSVETIAEELDMYTGTIGFIKRQMQKDGLL